MDDIRGEANDSGSCSFPIGRSGCRLVSAPVRPPYLVTEKCRYLRPGGAQGTQPVHPRGWCPTKTALRMVDGDEKHGPRTRGKSGRRTRGNSGRLYDPATRTSSVPPQPPPQSRSSTEPTAWCFCSSSPALVGSGGRRHAWR